MPLHFECSQAAQNLVRLRDHDHAIRAPFWVLWVTRCLKTKNKKYIFFSSQITKNKIKSENENYFI